MVSLVAASPPVNPLWDVQAHYGLFLAGGNVWIIDLKQGASSMSGSPQGLQMFNQAAGQLILRRHLEQLPVASDAKKVIGEFLVSPNTVVYSEVAFSPLQTPSSTLNLWTASPVIPAAGSWHLIRQFLLEVICGGDIALYRYIILFIAHMLQRPEEKPGILIALLGGQGTGKGTLFKLLSAIWPHTVLHVSNVDHVVGSFNAALERSYVVCMDEAMFAGDRRGMDRLKSLITEPAVTVEQKYQPRRTICSFHRFFAASNHAHFAQVDMDDRRFVFFRVSDQRKGDAAYWLQCHAAISDPVVIAAMVHDLLSYDLTKFNVRDRPVTVANIDQKLRSLAGFDRYWYEALQSGSLSANGNSVLPSDWVAPRFVGTTELMSSWKEFERSTRQFTSHQERDIHAALARLCPSAQPSRKAINNRQQRGHNLPALAIARGEFEQNLGGQVTWHD